MESEGRSVAPAGSAVRRRATVVVDTLRTHPQGIVGGILQENPFFVPPEQFLQELRGRHAPSP